MQNLSASIFATVIIFLLIIVSKFIGVNPIDVMVIFLVYQSAFAFAKNIDK